MRRNTRAARAQPSVVHLDHSVEAGGAELALARLLAHSPQGTESVIVPAGAGLGVFSQTDGRAAVATVGPPQEPGLSRGGGVALVAYGWRLVATAWIVRRHRLVRAADVIHTNTSRAGVYGALASLLSRKTLVVHLRDLTNADSLGRFGLFAFRNTALRRADLVIANSRTTLESASPYLRDGQDRMILASPIGMDRSQPSRGERGAAMSCHAFTSIGMVARLSPWKGQHLLIRAFAESFADTDVRLQLAGAALLEASDYADELAALVEQLHVAEQVDFMGHVDNVAGFIAQQDICVHAAIRPEPLGQNVLQYLVSGRPVVAAAAGGPAEWITHGVNGLLYPMGDSAALAESLLRLASSAELRQRLAAGAAATAGLHDDEEVARLHRAAYARPSRAAARSRRTGPARLGRAQEAIAELRYRRGRES